MDIQKIQELVNKANYIHFFDGKFVCLIYGSSDQAKEAIEAVIYIFPYDKEAVVLGVNIHGFTHASILLKSVKSPLFIETNFIELYSTNIQENSYNGILKMKEYAKDKDFKRNPKSKISLMFGVIEDGEIKMPYLGESDNYEEQVLSVNIVFLRVNSSINN